MLCIELVICILIQKCSQICWWSLQMTDSLKSGNKAVWSEPSSDLWSMKGGKPPQAWDRGLGRAGWPATQPANAWPNNQPTTWLILKNLTPQVGLPMLQY